MKLSKTQQLGFTLIEMIVSLAVFSIVITISVGALLILIGTNQQLQNEQSVMTNLSFALDSMAREIRTGTHYHCDSQDSDNAPAFGEKIFLNNSILDPDTTQDCPNGNDQGRKYHGMSFVEGGESITGAPDTRIVYYFDNDPGTLMSPNPNQGKIMRRVSGQAAQSIVSSGIYITDMEFYVTGSDPLSTLPANTEVDQSTVTLFIEAKDVNDPTAKPYQIQTTITQRTLDI